MNKSAIKDFSRFVEKEIEPAMKDLENLEEKNRVHVQKLVYTNIVDRFDTMIDVSILDNCQEEAFSDSAMKDMTGTVTESDLIKVLLQGDNLQGALDIKLKNGLRNTVLRQRHSLKLNTLFSVFKPEINCMGAQRVNISTGLILEAIKPQLTTVPYSIAGYADWLYSRRNSVVHGAGSNAFLQNDIQQLKNFTKKSRQRHSKLSFPLSKIRSPFIKKL